MRKVALLFGVVGLLAAPIVVPSTGSVLAQDPDPVVEMEPLHDFGTTNPPQHGVATLVRNADGIAVTVDTRHLMMMTPHTFWIVIWNDPSECSDPCGENDLGVPGNAVVFGGALTVDANGKMFVSSGLTKDVAVGDERCCFGQLTDPFAAEIHIIVREHPEFDNTNIHTHLQSPTPPPANDVQSAVFK